MTPEIPQKENLPETQVTSDATPPVETLGKAYDLLQQLLNENDGVISKAAEAALELRNADPGLFDYTVNRGIGILGCRRTQGRGYEVFPIHWPEWQNPEPIEKERFVGRYRRFFEEAGLVKKQGRSARF
jgi:hypothetical protein